jgi:acyl carrier protein
MENLTQLSDEDKIELLKKAFLYARPEEKDRAENLDLEAPIEQLGIQSITALEMAGYIEEELDIEFSDKELTEINRIKDLIDLIDKATDRKING